MRPKKEKPKVKTGNYVVSVYFGPGNSFMTISGVSAVDTKQLDEIDYSKRAICMSGLKDGELKSRTWIPIKSINLITVEDEYKVKGEK